MARRIAVIDDGAIRDLLAELLADEDYEPLVFADGAAALPALDGHPPDALDLGPAAAASAGRLGAPGRPRADSALRTLPVLVCTGDERTVGDQAAVLERPGCAVLAKPFALADLLATLVRLGVTP